MKTSFARKVLLGAAIAASMGIGYAIGAQPHMTASIGLVAIGPRRTRRRDAEQGRPPRKSDAVDRSGDRRGPRRHRLCRRLTRRLADQIGRDFMNRLIATAFVFGMMVGGANAMPMAPLAPATNSDVIEVAGGCGRGWHRGPYGGCRRNYARPGRARLPARLVSRPLRPLPRQRDLIDTVGHARPDPRDLPDRSAVEKSRVQASTSVEAGSGLFNHVSVLQLHAA